MICSKCGATNPDGTMFCAECGTPVSALAAPVEAAPVVPAAVAAPVAAAPVIQQPQFQPQGAYQQPQPQQYQAVDKVKPVAMDTLNIFLTGFTKPMAAFNDVVSGRKMICGYIIGGIQILFTFIALLVSFNAAIGAIGALLVAGAYAAKGFAAYLFRDKSNPNLTFPILSAAFSSLSTYGICAVLVAMIAGLINGGLGTLIYILALIFWVTISSIALFNITTGSTDKKAFAAAVTSMCITVVSLMIVYIYVYNALSDLFRIF